MQQIVINLMNSKLDFRKESSLINIIGKVRSLMMFMIERI